VLKPEMITRREEDHLRSFCRSQVSRWQRRIARLVQARSMRKAQRASRQMRRKLGVRLYALLQASRKAVEYDPENMCLEQLRRRRLTLAFEHLRDINCFDAPAQGTVWNKSKSSGEGVRPICSFNWTDKARQHLLDLTLQPFAGYHPSQSLLRFGNEGRGVTAACKALLEALGGCADEHVFVQIDVKDFFGSISHEWLESNLPLAGGTIRRHVHTGEMNLKMRDTACKEIRLSRTARQGIPQGSALSQLVAEMVMSDILRGITVPPGVRIVTYADNIGMVVPKGCEAAVEELFRGAFERHGAGPFQLTCSKPVPVTNSFPFLGLSFAVREGTPTVDVPEETWGVWLCEIGDEVLVASPKELADIERKARGKLAQWRMCSGIEALETRAFSLIASGFEALMLGDDHEEATLIYQTV
jgi:RNA-directed DNA polymerase